MDVHLLIHEHVCSTYEEINACFIYSRAGDNPPHHRECDNQWHIKMEMIPLISLINRKHKERPFFQECPMRPECSASLPGKQDYSSIISFSSLHPSVVVLSPPYLTYSFFAWFVPGLLVFSHSPIFSIHHSESFASHFYSRIDHSPLPFPSERPLPPPPPVENPPSPSSWLERGGQEVIKCPGPPPQVRNDGCRRTGGWTVSGLVYSILSLASLPSSLNKTPVTRSISLLQLIFSEKLKCR